MQRWLPILLLCACSLPQGATAPAMPLPPGAVEVLGVAQDGGRPQLGCVKDCCATLGPEDAEPVASLAVMGDAAWVLVDATPDLPQQVQAVGSLPDAIVLTHAHMGHYLGLAFLGREALGARGLPVYCSSRMADFLKAHGPWSQLVELGNIQLRTFEDGVPFDPIPGVRVKPWSVPHRDEFSDTFGFSFLTVKTRLFYLPDIDGWEDWPRLDQVTLEHQVLLLDGTFYDNQELPGRDMSLIPHPRVPDSMRRLQGAVEEGVQVLFLHLNHTNPLWDANSPQRQTLRRRGFDVAVRGQRFGLAAQD
ncbi:MAG: MBL fold metallo-hydrolase [Planctomycetota bacterium]